MTVLTIVPKNKKEEKIVTAILNGLEIKFFTEKEEETALAKAIEKGMKSRTLSAKEKASFIASLKN